MDQLRSKLLLDQVKQARRTMPDELLAQISNGFSAGDYEDQFIARSLDLAQKNFEGLLTQIEVLLSARTEQGGCNDQRTGPRSTTSLLNNYLDSIMLGDCCTAMQKLPAKSVDLILTDPPYLVNYKSRDGRMIAGDTSDAWLVPAFGEAYRALKPDRLCISFYGWSKADRYLAAWRQAGFRPVGHFVWIKSYTSGSAFLQYRHEQAYLLAKGSPDRPLSPISDVQYWKYTGNQLHPMQKSVRGLMRLIRAFSSPGDIVLDPFCGSGSVPLAAKILGRRYIGVELRQDYFGIAERRLKRNCSGREQLEQD